MKHLVFSFILFFPLSVMAQITTNLTVEATGCEQLNLYAFNGVEMEKIQSLQATDDGGLDGGRPYGSSGLSVRGQ
jgi:hypothetical protein